MPGLRRDNHKHGGNKQRVLLDGARYEPGPAAKPRAYQQPTLSPAPFVPRTAPEATATPDLPLWPGWHDDPTGRHESRYFDGIAWTDNVQDGVRASKDPLEPAAQSQFDVTGLVPFQVSAETAAEPATETNGNGNGNGHLAGNGNGNGHTNGNGNGNGHHEEPATVDAAALLTGTVPLEG
jgi:hypothetical protein